MCNEGRVEEQVAGFNPYLQRSFLANCTTNGYIADLIFQQIISK
jgi:hypothetical protein